MREIKIPAEKLVSGAQVLVNFYPIPTPEQIDDILARLCRAFEVPFTVESDAKLIWRQRVGIAAHPFRVVADADLPA